MNDGSNGRYAEWCPPDQGDCPHPRLKTATLARERGTGSAGILARSVAGVGMRPFPIHARTRHRAEGGPP